MTDPDLGTDEFDVPLGGLVGMQRVQLGRTHMEAAAAEVRFVASRSELSDADAKRIWALLGTDAWPVFEPHEQKVVNVVLGPGGLAQQAEQSQSGWVLATPDRSTVITLLPTLVLVHAARYERYSVSLAGPLRAALAAFTEVTGASVVQRIGLRYVNRLTKPAATTPAFWADHIRPAFAGPLASRLGALVENQLQQVQLRLDDTAGARVHCGAFREADPSSRQSSFLVDLDVFRERALEYGPERCANLARQLNRTALALFAEVLSEQYLAELGPTPVEKVSRT